MEKPHTKNSTNVRTNSATLGAVLRGLEWVSPALSALAAEPVFMGPARIERPLREELLLREAKRSRVSYAGLALPVYSWGRGPTVVFAHGWQGRGTQAEPFIAPLVNAGFRVVAFDVPGHGDAPRALVTVVDFARVLLRVVEEIGDVHGAIGHSVGGAAITLASGLSPFAQRIAVLGAPLHPRGFLAQFVSGLGLSQATYDALAGRIERRYGIAMADIDTRHHAPHIRAQALIVHDRQDREVSFEHGRELAAAWPGARLLATEGLGHRRILRDPGVVAEVVRHVSAGPFVHTTLEQELSQSLFAPELRRAAG